MEVVAILSHGSENRNTAEDNISEKTLEIAEAKEGQ